MEQTPRQSDGRQPAARRQFAPRLAGAVLLAVTGAIHLDLYLTGYRHIPTIGGLFLLQVIAAFVLAAAVLLAGSPLIAAAGAGFAIATLGGYLLTLWVGLFGFQEVGTTAGLVAGIVEVAAFAALAYVTVSGLADSGPLAAPLARLRTGLPGGAYAAVAAAAAAALVVLGVSVGTASGSGGAGSASAGSGGAVGGSGPGVKIIIKNFMFRPDNPDVHPGERIEVTNEDAVAHSFTAGPAAKDKNLFTTGLVGPDQTKIIKAPKQDGMYPFYCTVHHFMTGMLIVGE